METIYFHSMYALLKNHHSKPGVELQLEIKIRRFESHFYSKLLDETPNELVVKCHSL